MATEKKRSKKEIDDILATAKERYRLCVEGESHIRTLELEDMDFRAGNQWPTEIKIQREIDNRPCLTINRIPQFVRQITNDQRQNRPAIRVSPLNQEADPEIAEIFQGLIRHVEYSSNADTAYDTAFESAVIKGRGYFRIITDYCDPYSFEQELKFEHILDSQSVKFDVFSKMPDGSDAKWCIIDVQMSKDDFTRQYPNSELGAQNDWESFDEKQNDWITKDSVKVAEYFYIDYKDVEIALLADGTTVPLEQIKDKSQVVKTRKSQGPIVRWLKVNAVEILEETVFPSEWIPVIPVYGDQLIVAGKRHFEGIIRHAKDPQRQYNYMASAQTEAIALAPKAPYVGAEGQFEDHEAEWKQANTKNLAYLEYKQVDLNGQQAPPPQRQQFEPAIQAISASRNISAEDLKATTGMYDASIGMQEPDQSGDAIQRLRAQSQTSNFHFGDNLRRSQRHAGRICVDAIPKVYDTARAIRVVGEDDQEKVVLINQVFQEGQKQKSYYLGVGEYDVVCDNGPSYQTKRQEAVASLLDFIKAYPQAAPLIADLLAKYMDWPGAQEIARRLRAMVPPQVLNADQNKEIPPEAQAQMSQMQSMIQQLTGQLAANHQILEKRMVETASKERIEMAKVKAAIEINMAKLGSQAAETLLEHDVARIEANQDRLQAAMDPEVNPTGGASPGQSTGGPSPGVNQGANQ